MSFLDFKFPNDLVRGSINQYQLLANKIIPTGRLTFEIVKVYHLIEFRVGIGIGRIDFHDAVY
jgi:hypothetical protein